MLKLKLEISIPVEVDSWRLSETVIGNKYMQK